VLAALESWEHGAELAVVAIDPAVADTAAMSEAYDLGMDTGAYCVVVGGRRDGEERVAACLVRADTRADVNNVVKRTLDVRKCSFLAMERAVEETGMEYGGITPVGLPGGWRLLVDPRVLDIEVAVIGSGVRRSKLLLPGSLAAALPGAEVVEGLAG
jgi:prolyl-tRNA editing enzyme YbaK/EbsC (Cys-tRNA(Pro) deacylase)